MDIVIATTKSVILSERQVEIAKLISNEVSRKDIAKQLGISVRTIEKHLEVVKEKLGVHSQTAMIATLLRQKIIE